MSRKDEMISMMYQAKAFKQPIVESYMDAVEKKLFDQWKASEAGKAEDREVLFLQCLGLQEFRKFVKKVIIEGEMAEKEVNEKLEKETKAST